MRYEYIAGILNKIFLELKQQRDIYDEFQNGILNFDAQMRNLDEYINSAGEFGVAYEIIVVLLEKYSFKISGGNAVGLLEIGLMFGFKTSRDIDAKYSAQEDDFGS